MLLASESYRGSASLPVASTTSRLSLLALPPPVSDSAVCLSHTCPFGSNISDTTLRITSGTSDSLLVLFLHSTLNFKPISQLFLDHRVWFQLPAPVLQTQAEHRPPCHSRKQAQLGTLFVWFFSPSCLVSCSLCSLELGSYLCSLALSLRFLR